MVELHNIFWHFVCVTLKFFLFVSCPIPPRTKS